MTERKRTRIRNSLPDTEFQKDPAITGYSIYGKHGRMICLYDTEGRDIYMRSDAVKKGSQQAPHRSLFNALGFTKEEMERPHG